MPEYKCQRWGRVRHAQGHGAEYRPRLRHVRAYPSRATATIKIGSLPPSSLCPLDGSKNLPSALISPIRHSQFKFQRNFDDEPCGPMAISPVRVGEPTRRGELAPGHALLIFDREALRAPALKLCRPNHITEWPSQLPMVFPARRPILYPSPCHSL